MAAHTAIAGMQKVPPDVIRSLRDGTPLDDPQLEALRAFTRAIVEKRGWVSDDDVKAFIDAGYLKRHLLEVILGVGFKTLSNYANHVAETPVDANFQRFAWSSPRATAGA